MAPTHRSRAAPVTCGWFGYVPHMDRRYDQSDLNVYGAEDDDEMDSILDALALWERGEADDAR